MIDGAPDRARRGRVVRAPRTARRRLPRRPPGSAPSVSFTEEMKGYVDLRRDGLTTAASRGREAARALMFHLTITADDIDRFIADRAHEARSQGWVRVRGARRPAPGRARASSTCSSTRTATAAASGCTTGSTSATARAPAHPRWASRWCATIPGFDVWSDTTTLFTRVLRGHVATGARRSAEVRGDRDPAHPPPRLRPPADDLSRRSGTSRRRARALRLALRRRAVGGLRAAGAQGSRVAERQRSKSLIPFTAGDGVELQPRQRARAASRRRGRRSCWSTAPACGRTSSARRRGRTLVDELVDAGYDVWLENWRASIDVPPTAGRSTRPPCSTTRRPCGPCSSRRGADEVKAVIHCQGSTSFMMSAVAGLVPEVTTIVSNAVSLHPVVSPAGAKLKMRWMLPPAAAGARLPRPAVGRRGSTVGAAEGDHRGWVQAHPPRVRQHGLQARQLHLRHRLSRRCGATRTSTPRRTSGSRTSSPTCR